MSFDPFRNIPEGTEWYARVPCGCWFCPVHSSTVLALGRDWRPIAPPLTHFEKHSMMEWEQELVDGEDTIDP